MPASPNRVDGIAGYSEAVDRFIVATMAVGFDRLHESFLPLLPEAPGRVVDLGAGIGRDAAELAARGYDVVAVEPLADFRGAGRRMFGAPRVRWVADSLPDLVALGETERHFDFALASAVWHHLSEADQRRGLHRVSELLVPGGTFAVSLRFGPAGLGRRVFPIDEQGLIDEARAAGFRPILRESRRPSLLPGKAAVTWSRLAFEKSYRPRPRSDSRARMA